MIYYAGWVGVGGGGYLFYYDGLCFSMLPVILVYLKKFFFFNVSVCVYLIVLA